MPAHRNCRHLPLSAVALARQMLRAQAFAADRLDAPLPGQARCFQAGRLRSRREADRSRLAVPKIVDAALNDAPAR